MAQFRRISGGFEVSFSIHQGKRGKKIEQWAIRCRGVHEAKISEMDGGGLGLYPSDHPAARQYVTRRAELRWPRTCDETKVLAALFRAHVETVDDWIPLGPVYDLWAYRGEGICAGIGVGVIGAVIREDGTKKKLSERHQPGAV